MEAFAPSACNMVLVEGPVEASAPSACDMVLVEGPVEASAPSDPTPCNMVITHNNYDSNFAIA